MDITTLEPYSSDVRTLAKDYVTFRIGKFACGLPRHTSVYLFSLLGQYLSYFLNISMSTGSSFFRNQPKLAIMEILASLLENKTFNLWSLLSDALYSEPKRHVLLGSNKIIWVQDWSGVGRKRKSISRVVHFNSSKRRALNLNGWTIKFSIHWGNLSLLDYFFTQ